MGECNHICGWSNSFGKCIKPEYLVCPLSNVPEEIKLHRRVKYAGDVYNALVSRAGWDGETAAAFLDSIPDAKDGVG